MKTEIHLQLEKLCLLVINELSVKIDSSINKSIDEKLKSIINNTSEDRLITTPELQKLLSISKSGIESLKRKKLPYYKIGDNVRFKKQEVLEFLKQYQEQEGGQVSK